MLPKPIILCAGKKCCPVLTQVEKDAFQIADDYSNVDIFSKSQLKEFYNEAKNSKANQISFGKVKMDVAQALELSQII